MAKSNYTDEEIKQFLQELFLEKKKSKELSDNLQKRANECAILKQELEQVKQAGVATASPPAQNEETLKLKKLLLVFKNKYENTLAEYETKEKKYAELTQEASLAQTREEEIRSLSQQLATLKELYLNVQKGIKKTESENQHLQHSLQQYKQSQKNEDEASAQIQKLNQKLEEAQNAIQQTHREAKKFAEEKARLQEQLRAETRRANELQADLQKIDSNSSRDASSLHDQINKLNQSLSESRSEVARLSQLQTRDEDAAAQVRELNQRLEEAKTALQQARREVQKYSQEKIFLQEQFNAETSKVGDLQARLQIADQKKAGQGDVSLETAELKESLAAAQAESERHKEAYIKLMVKFEEIDSLRATFEKQNLELVRQLHTLEPYKEMTIAAQARISEFERQLNDAENEIEKIQGEAENQARLKAGFDAQIRTFKSKILDLEEQVRKQSEALIQSGEAASAFEEEKVFLGRQFETLKSNLSNVQNELKEAREANQRSLEKINHSETARSELNRRVTELEAELKQADNVKIQLANALEDINELNREFEDAKAQNGREKQKIEKLAHIIQEREHRIAELQQIEISLKRTSEMKQELEAALENEQNARSQVQQEKDSLEEVLKENRQHIDQLERVIQFLRERSNEAQLELNQLREEYQRDQDTIKLLEGQLEQSRTEILKLNESIQEQEREKSEALEEIQTLHSQFDVLRNQSHSLQKDLETQKAARDITAKERDEVLREKATLEMQLRDKLQCIDAFDREVGLIKQTLIRALREAKDIESRYAETVKEKAAASAKLHQAQHQLEKFREQECLLQDQLEASFDSLSAANATIHELQKQLEQIHRRAEEEIRDKVSETESIKSVLKDKEEEALALHSQLAAKQQDVRQLQNDLSQNHRQIEEKDAEIRQAQQHLAKKVKEMAILEDKYEAQKNQVADLQQSLTHNKVKIAELQASLDVQGNQQKRMEDQMQEAIKSFEIQQAKWEEKYLGLYEKWQAAESRVRELEKLEEKHKQLQGLLSNLGNFMGGPAGYIQQAGIMPAPPVEPPKAAVKHTVEPEIHKSNAGEQKEQSKPYQNLFNMPKSSGKPKQDLLE